MPKRQPLLRAFQLLPVIELQSQIVNSRKALAKRQGVLLFRPHSWKGCHHSTRHAQGPVAADLTEPGTKWTLVDLSETNDPNTGDIYSGLDRFGRVKDNRWYNYGSSADVDRIKCGYARAGSRTWRQSVVANSLSQPFDELCHYDGTHRLKAMARGTLSGSHDAISNKSLAECWSLDATNNWKGYCEDNDGNGSWNLVQDRSMNQANEITGISETTGPSWVTPSYSRSGNMTTIPQPLDPTTSYTATYDAWNRLVSLSDGTDAVTKYQYDGSNRRTVVMSYASGSLDETRHAYFTDARQWQVIEERVDSSTDAERQYVWGLRYIDELVLRDRDINGDGVVDERLYALQEANWSVTALLSASGATLTRFAYQPYGQSEALNADFTSYSGTDHDWVHRFTGRELDRTTQLYDFRNRYYHSRLGVFLSRDREEYVDGMNLFFPYFVPSSVDPFGNSCVKFEYPPIERYTRPEDGSFPVIPLPLPGMGVKIDGRGGFTVSIKGQQCDKCCPDGRRVKDDQFSASGKVLMESRITAGYVDVGGIKAFLQTVFPLFKISYYFGFRLRFRLEESFSGGGSTDKCNGKNDPGFEVCISPKASVRLSGGGEVRLSYGILSYRVSLELFGELTVAEAKACIKCNGSSCNSDLQIGGLTGTIGIKACLAACFEFTLW
ncbi:hypothetical protein DTL42_09690 [Bremerella cremea]|uniref:Uncharacterized protein n=2 Tax=Bremerella cremea TaxID=1031537 RepID=A0A368KSI2_9BACT|nr:hypothetical protein DTL42_09690 [Bremerella cremea]